MPVYLLIDGIEGTVVRNKAKWIELDSVQVHPPYDGQKEEWYDKGGVRRKASPYSFTLTKAHDTTSSRIFEFFHTQVLATSADIDFAPRDHVAGGVEPPAMIIRMKEAWISSYSSNRLVETFGLHCVDFRPDAGNASIPKVEKPVPAWKRRMLR